MSLFNFKKRADNPYELGDRIGEGGFTCDFYNIKDEKVVGVKLFNNRKAKLKWEVQEKIFERDIEIGNLLRRRQIPVPIYVGIIDVYNSEDEKFVKGLAIEIIGDEVLIKPKIVEQNCNYFVPGEINFLNKNREIQEAVSNTLNLMLKKLNVSKKELIRRLNSVDFQGLYSHKTKVFYLIDFNGWRYFFD